MSTDLVVRLGANLDDFESGMKKAGDLADTAVSKIESSFSKLQGGLGLGNVALAIAGGVAGVSALIALVAALNKNLSDMAGTAERVGLSFEKFQQLRFAANSLGVGDGDFNTSLDSFATKLQDAKFHANDLTRVFAANGVEIRKANGDLKTSNELIDKAFDLIKRAPKIQDALQIGSMLGISRTLSQAIFSAGDEFLKLASKANAAGAVIDDQTIEKAKKFTSEWDKATALWGAKLKAALGEILPLLNDAVNAATRLLQYTQFASDFVGSIKDFAFGVDIETAPIEKLNQILEQYNNIRAKIADDKPLNPTELFQVSNIPNVDGEVSLKMVDVVIDQIKERIAKLNADPKIKVVIPTGAGASVNPGPNLPDDIFDRAAKSIERHTERLKADAAATGLGEKALQSLRAEFTLLEAAKQAGIKVDDETAARIKKIATAAGEAGEALAKARVIADIQFGARTALLTDDDIRIAQQLKQIYGNEVPEALASTYAAQLRINDAAKGLTSTLSSGLTTAIVDVTTGTKTLGQSFADFGKIAVRAIEEAIIKLLIIGPLMRGLQSSFGSVFGGGEVLRNADPWNFPQFASGTNSAPGGMAWVGEEGPELVNLPRGSQVLPNGVVPGLASSIMAALNISIDARGADKEVEQRFNYQIEVLKASLPGMIVDTVKKAKTGRSL